jgi:hypothetical protein
MPMAALFLELDFKSEPERDVHIKRCHSTLSLYIQMLRVYLPRISITDRAALFVTRCSLNDREIRPEINRVRWSAREWVSVELRLCRNRRDRAHVDDSLDTVPLRKGGRSPQRYHVSSAAVRM